MADELKTTARILDLAESRKKMLGGFRVAGFGAFDICLMRRDGSGHDWFRIPSWIIEFSGDLFKDIEVRLHKAPGLDEGWNLSIAHNGFAIFKGPYQTGAFETLELFLNTFRRSREDIDAAIRKADATMSTITPSGFPPAAPAKRY